MSRDASYITDILQAAHLIQTFAEGIEKEAFEDDLMCQSAVVRQLEIIGEATKRLSEAFKASHPLIPWRKMAGMRDILIHAYDHVDMDEVWNAATVSIPGVISLLELVELSSED